MPLTRILSAVLLLSQVACIGFALPWTKPSTRTTPEGTRNTEPGNSLLDSDMVGAKAVIGKEWPNRLFARDGTTCTVAPDKYDRIAIGASALCIWSKTGR